MHRLGRHISLQAGHLNIYKVHRPKNDVGPDLVQVEVNNHSVMIEADKLIEAIQKSRR